MARGRMAKEATRAFIARTRLMAGAILIETDMLRVREPARGVRRVQSRRRGPDPGAGELGDR